MMALSNAEVQRRWRERRNKLAKQASTIGGLITALAHHVKGKSDAEIEKVIARVTARLRQSTRSKHRVQRRAEPTNKPKQAAALVWEEGPGDQFIAKVERGSVYAVYSTARIGYGSGYAARRKTRSGSGDIGLGHTDTSEQAKELCERHYTGRKD
jgi:hypothetical protein